MTAKTLMWMDLRTTFSGPDLCASLPLEYQTRRLRNVPHLLTAMQSSHVWAICFEYDILDARGLAALHEVQDRYLPPPILMLMERQARAIAKSAFRRYVWDYLVKPVSVPRLCSCLTRIERGEKPTEGDVSAQPCSASAAEGLFARSSLAPAASYVTQNYPEKLCQATAAKLCDLSPFQFSRAFKKTHGLTFRDYVVHVRIDQAAELLRQQRASVTEATFVVGFNDLSHFARMFRKRIGVSPSHYRTDHEPAQMQLFLPQETRRR